MRVFALQVCAAALLAHASGAAAQVTKYPNTPPGLILQSVSVGAKSEILFLSGQLASPLDPAKPPSASMTVADYGDTKTQTISTLTKIKTILASHGYAMADVIKLTVFVAAAPDMEGKMDFAGMNAGFKTFFGTPDNPGTVARSTIQVAALAGPAYLVEIEATAAKPAK